MIGLTAPMTATAHDAATIDDELTAGATEEVASFIEVDKLADAGIPTSDIAKLRTANIYTIQGITMQCKRDLVAIKGLSEPKIDRILEVAEKMTFSGFISAKESFFRRSQVTRITTGSHALDTLMGGGIESMSITEAFGEFRSGKTQLALTLCVTSQLPRSMGGGNGRVAYIDTESTFRPERVRPIAERFGLDPDATLENIIVARAYTHEHQCQLLSMVGAKLSEDQFSLIVIDSVTALFRADFTGRGELAERQQKLGKMLSNLMKMAEEYNVAVFITNQVVSDPGAGSLFVPDPKKPVGGHILAHASTTRLSLRKGRGDQRICKIYDSPMLPESECVFAITEQGVTDPRD
ncbi:RAD51/dmc1 protein [Perkinsela sp. CCAP 1560/4]|nr:RAD51/dmc1 protein [Perkinsela sp. CCAP 1560/4]|eukprot:KNH04180.1 RAD51/dmc1 protein [Perkinsela sp. CCAP 1560/4]